METNITKGEFETRGNRIFIKDTYKSIATIEVQKNYEDITFKPIEDIEAIANGNLFTASKDLLEALQDLVRFCKENKVGAELEMAEKALEKALT